MKKSLQMGGVILASLLTATSCQTEEVVNNDIQSNNFSLTVNMGPESRTYIDENNKCVWGDYEKIYVTSKDGKTTGVLSLTQKSEDGTSATFSGFVFGDPADLYYSGCSDGAAFLHGQPLPAD